MLIRTNFLMYFIITCIDDVALIVLISLLLSWLYVGYQHGFMKNSNHGSYHVLIGK